MVGGRGGPGGRGQEGAEWRLGDFSSWSLARRNSGKQGSALSEGGRTVLGILRGQLGRSVGRSDWRCG